MGLAGSSRTAPTVDAGLYSDGPTTGPRATFPAERPLLPRHRGLRSCSSGPRWTPPRPRSASRENIPPGSKVVGDDKFYFLVRRDGSDFQYLERGGTLAERVAYHAGHVRIRLPDHDLDEDSDILSAYRASTDLVKVGTVECPDPQQLDQVSALGSRSPDHVGRHPELRRDHLQAGPVTSTRCTRRHRPCDVAPCSAATATSGQLASCSSRSASTRRPQRDDPQVKQQRVDVRLQEAVGQRHDHQQGQRDQRRVAGRACT